MVSPILFCIYIHDLLVSLSETGVGCYVAGNFFGAIAYADDIVSISPTPLGMRKLFFTCDLYANEFDILFNASKSKFLACISRKLRSVFNNLNLNGCFFYIGVENVSSYSHLGHIINCKCDDKDDVLLRRNHFIGKANNVLGFFKTLNMHYCSSVYGKFNNA